MTLYGWDASDYDHARGPMDMKAAYAAGVSFFTHKATEGTSGVHHPGPHLAAARDAGIPFLGAYVVPRSAPTVPAQVDYLLSWMDKQAPWWRTFDGWFWQVDTEHWGYDQVSAQRGHDVAQLLAQLTNRVVLHYAPEWAYGNSIPQPEPLWASNYVAGTGGLGRLYPGDRATHWHPYSGRTPAILQYTSSATIGSQTGCDGNAFRGDEAAFAALIGRSHTMTQDEIVDLASAIVQWATRAGALPGNYRGANTNLTTLEAQLHQVQATLSAVAQTVGTPAPVSLADAQVEQLATKITDALVASTANTLTDADHAAVKADLAAVLSTVKLQAG